MTVRQKRIWDLLMGESFLTAKDIGHHLHISDRTVRSDIKEINVERGKEVILSKKGQGYYIEEPESFWDMRAAGALENEENLEWEVVRRVLFDDNVPYLEMADELYISDTLLSKIVSRINRRMISRYGKGSIRKQSGSLVMELTEEEKRDYYSIYITTKNLNQFFEVESFSPYFERADILWIKELVFQELGSQKNQLFDATIMRLIIGIGVMAERMAAGHFVPEGEDVQAEAAVGNMMKAIEDTMKLQAPRGEYSYFQQMFRNDFYYMEGADNGLARGILEEILTGVSVEYGYDFSGDEEFCQEMMAQIIGTLRRNQNKQLKINPILHRIKAQYPLEYDIAIFFADRFNRLTGCVVGQDEVGFFAVHIIRAMETKMMRTKRKVALVNPFGKPVKELIRKRLEDMGECQLEIGENYSVFDMPACFPKDILAVLTTVPLQAAPADVPVILCRNFLDYHEKEKLLTVVRDQEVSSVGNYFKRLFKPSLFFTEMEYDSPRSVLEFMCGQLRDQGYVGDTFLESVMGRENVASTVFETGFAIAHDMENTAIQTAVSVCTLKERIAWGDGSVKMVFLLALAPSWNHNMVPVYNVMIGNLMKAGTMRQLSKAKDCKTFVDSLLAPQS